MTQPYLTPSRRAILMSVAGLGGAAALAACGSAEPGSSPTASGAPGTGLPDLPADLLEKARAEGTVTMWTASSTENYEKFYKDAFEAAYPGIKVSLYQADGSTRDARFMKEFEAGVSKVDVFSGSAGGPNARMKPAKMLKDIRPYLVEDILNGKNWAEGEVPWMDEEKSYLLQSDLKVVPMVALADGAASSLTAWSQLLDPAWDKKLVMSDPRKAGMGFAMGLLLHFADALGPDFVADFYKNKRVTFSDDARQVANWIDRAEKSVALGPVYQEYLALEKLGSKAKLVQTLEAGGKQLGGYISSDGILFLPNQEKLPHDNAARVYVNWFYSRAGQQAMIDVLQVNSGRADVDRSSLPSFLVPAKDAVYLNLNHYTSAGQVTEMRDAVGKALLA